MYEVNLKTKTEYLVPCPFCGDYDHSVSHLMGRYDSFGPWYCDECGKAIEGRVQGDKVFIEKTNRYLVETLSVLELSEIKEPIFFIVKGMEHDGEPRNLEYFYQDHQCPTNFLKDTIELIHKNEDDPHGLFKYLKTAYTPKSGVDSYSVEDFQKLFNFQKTLT